MSVILLGEKTTTMDSKGRVIIPNHFMFQENEEVAFGVTGEPYFNIYPLIKLQELLDRLEQMKKLRDENYKDIVNKLRIIYASIIDTYRMDDQRRILLPKQIRETVPEKKVILQGVNTHISLIQHQESYDAFCRRYIPENVGIKKW